MMRPKHLFVAATIFAGAVCIGPVQAGFINGDALDTSSVVKGLTSADIYGVGDMDSGNAGDTGPYYMAWDMLTGNTYTLAGGWAAIASCTADKCISDLKDGPVAAQAVSVPEPGMLALLGLALGLLGFMTRRLNA